MHSTSSKHLSILHPPEPTPCFGPHGNWLLRNILQRGRKRAAARLRWGIGVHENFAADDQALLQNGSDIVNQELENNTCNSGEHEDLEDQGGVHSGDDNVDDPDYLPSDDQSQDDIIVDTRLSTKTSLALYDRDRTGKTPLHYCCTSDNIYAAQGADIIAMAAPDLIDSKDDDGFTPLHLAVIAGNMQLVTFLLANNADVNAVDNEKHTVVHWATGK
ncbi:unnamed protein product [Phaedon cochleariae]|uniref:Uncharacterized protein n=1 Tax=Phaedon cochleariae TaxID=80249 RepID=A0A9N9SFS2_PHACE|nr:unnamed protein product [Phaedon cochleariae]